MELRQRQEGRLEQRQELRLTQQLIQKLEMLQLPILELQEVVLQELQENPTLELKEEVEEPEASAEPKEADSDQKEIDLPEDWEFEWQDRPRSKSRNAEEEGEEYMEMMSNVEADAVTLEDHIERQLALMEIPDEPRKILAVVAGLLDEDGYLRRPIKDEKDRVVGHQEISNEEIADILMQEEPFKSMPREEVISRVKTAIEGILHRLDPPGIGARTTKECLLLQLPEDTPFYEIKRKLIEEHLDDIAENKLPKIAREMMKDPRFMDTFAFTPYTLVDEVIDTLKMLLEDIRKLNPKPGRNFQSLRPSRVIPEVVIKDLGNGNYEPIMNDAYVPDVVVNETYRKILRDPNASPEQKEFIRKKLANARALVEAIGHRRELIYRIAKKIVEVQREFLEKGIDYLKPLKMKTLANEFGVHISTISRAVNSKYVQCPQGIFPMKFFFATAASRSNLAGPFFDGEKRAKVTILDVIKDIVGNEDKSNPLSDEQIARLLKERGITASRRAVTKYRKELGIPSSKVRKQY